MLVSRNSRLNVCVLKLNLLQFEVFFSFHLITASRNAHYCCVMRQSCLCFKERESSLEEVVKIVNFRYRHYQYGHSDKLIKTRFRYTGCRGPFLKYNKANNISSTGKRRLALECQLILYYCMLLFVPLSLINNKFEDYRSTDQCTVCRELEV